MNILDFNQNNTNLLLEIKTKLKEVEHLIGNLENRNLDTPFFKHQLLTNLKLLDEIIQKLEK